MHTMAARAIGSGQVHFDQESRAVSAGPERFRDRSVEAIAGSQLGIPVTAGTGVRNIGGIGSASRVACPENVMSAVAIGAYRCFE